MCCVQTYLLDCILCLLWKESFKLTYKKENWEWCCSFKQGWRNILAQLPIKSSNHNSNGNEHLQHIDVAGNQGQTRCLSVFCLTVSCLSQQQMISYTKQWPCYMPVNGNCQLCQSKSNCPTTNLALLNLYLMFSPRPANLLSDYIILCRYISCSQWKAENHNYTIKTVSLIR